MIYRPTIEDCLSVFSAEIRRLIRHYPLRRTEITSIEVNPKLKRSIAYTSCRAERNDRDHSSESWADLSIASWMPEVAALAGEEWNLYIVAMARHEYAHVLEWDQDAKVSHSKRWKELCRLLGTYPRSWSDPEEQIAAVAAARLEA